MHWEIPSSDRFDIDPSDVAGIREFLFHARDRFGEGPSKALGQTAVTYGRFGNIPGICVFENSMVTMKNAGPFVDGIGKVVNVPRFLVTAVIPYSGSDDAAVDQSRQVTSDVTESALRFLLKRPVDGPLAQRNAGESVKVIVDPPGGDGRQVVHFQVRSGLTLRAWHGRQPLVIRQEPLGWSAADTALVIGSNVLVIEVHHGNRRVGYRSIDLYRSSSSIGTAASN